MPVSTRCRRPTVDFVTTFDCIHDMTDPQGMMAAIRRREADDVTKLLVDIKARDVRRERREEPDGLVDVRDQRALVHVLGACPEPGGAASASPGYPHLGPRRWREAGFTSVPPPAGRPAINAFYGAPHDGIEQLLDHCTRRLAARGPPSVYRCMPMTAPAADGQHRLRDHHADSTDGLARPLRQD